MNLHSLVSSPDFKEEEVDKIIEEHYAVGDKPKFMEMIETIKKTTLVNFKPSQGIELKVTFWKDEVTTEDKGTHIVEFPTVFAFAKEDSLSFNIDNLPLSYIVNMSMDDTLIENIIEGDKTKEAIAIHIVDHLVNFMDEYDY